MASIYYSCRKGCKGKEKEQYIKVHCVRVHHCYQYHITNGLFMWLLWIRNDCWVAVRVNSWLGHKTTPQNALAHFQNDNSLRKWVTMAASLQMRYNQPLNWHCQADSHLLWVITAESIPPGDILTCPHTPTDTRAQTDTQQHTWAKRARTGTYTNRHTITGIKVTESWQISAAAESLTWGCWIDKPSIGTLLAFSSF